MKSKKVLSLFLALAMLFALAIPALASTSSGDPTTNPTQTTTLSGDAKGYDVKLTVSPSGTVIINPYKINYTPTITGATFESAIDDQIINPGTFITNETNIPLKVSAQITPSLTDGIDLLDAFTKVNAKAAQVQLGEVKDHDNDPSTDDEWVGFTETDPVDTTQTRAKMTAYDKKAAFLAFEMKKAADAETEPTWSAPNAITAAAVAASQEDDDNALMVLATGANTITAAHCMKFAAVGEEDEPNYACFHLTGYLNVYPETPNDALEPTEMEDDPWATTDTIGAAVVLTFTPDVDASVPTAAATPSAGG